MSKRDLYDDSVFDVNSIEDILNEKSMTILANQEDSILFEFGNDFFKYDLQEKTMLQYPDFISLKNNVNYNDCSLTDYGFAMADSINNSEDLELLKYFDLKDRENYIKEELHGGIFTIPAKISDRINKNKNNFKDLPGKTKELDSITSMSNAFVDTLALLFCYYKSIKLKMTKEKLVEGVLQKYNQKNLYSIIQNKDLLYEVPELKNVVQKCNDFLVKVEVDKGFSTLQEKLDAVKDLADHAFSLGDPEILETCKKVAETEIFKNNISNVKEKLEVISDQLANDLPQLNQKLTDNISENLKSMNDIHKEGFTKLFSETLNLNPQNREDKLEFLIANNFLARALVKDTSDEYDFSIVDYISSAFPDHINGDFDKSFMKYISDSKELDTVRYGNVKYLVEQICENVLGVKEEKEIKFTITNS
ncbi:hypothetical protein [Chryseobacterium oncorhynchi]|uniref:Uncharacterized protein n=1 Tax=Chryseobacterium oncorhynchi TaxID=741074 RepID=A0A316WLB7_9FLAO|nr:hypothetical protein [Chryseobacterium oncorhynchi]PWN59968.1 hypothetical protein C1638_020590 [Chryseobacterium oncorhynchi]